MEPEQIRMLLAILLKKLGGETEFTYEEAVEAETKTLICLQDPVTGTVKLKLIEKQKVSQESHSL
jgi:hypothetical protein